MVHVTCFSLSIFKVFQLHSLPLPPPSITTLLYVFFFETHQVQSAHILLDVLPPLEGSKPEKAEALKENK